MSSGSNGMLKSMKALGSGLYARALRSVRTSRPVKTCQVAGLESLLATALSNIASGEFVEVGAFDGVRFSNTSWLADNGWRGLYIEPSPDFVKLCRLRHRFNNVVVLECAIGAEEGQIEFTQMGALSTVSNDALKAYESIDWAQPEREQRLAPRTTPVYTLDQVLDQQGWSPNFDLLVVDVEGFEEQVFQGFSLQHWRPRVIIAELCDVHPDFPDSDPLSQSAARVRRQLLESEYTEIYRDAINTVFQSTKQES